MLPTEIAYFTGTLFLALVMLIKWKRRRDLIAARLNRGLSGYVAAKKTVRRPRSKAAREQSLQPV
jgi:hypothetical protein